MPDRVITIARHRVRPWVDGFGRRHGEFTAALDATGALSLTAPDGATARLRPVVDAEPSPGDATSSDDETTGIDPVESFVAGCLIDRRIGVLLVRRGGHAVGIFDGPQLVSSKVGSHYVQGRTKAGGWSQQRYARRRANQARRAFADAAEDAARVLVPEAAELAAMVCGGDAAAVRTVLAEPALVELRELFIASGEVVLPVADPRLRVLTEFAEAMLSITIELNALA